MMTIATGVWWEGFYLFRKGQARQLRHWRYHHLQEALGVALHSFVEVGFLCFSVTTDKWKKNDHQHIRTNCREEKNASAEPIPTAYFVAAFLPFLNCSLPWSL